MRFCLLINILLLIAPCVWADDQAYTTLFLDGAKVVREVTPVKGYLEVYLPAAMRAGSFRVKAIGNSIITGVEVAPTGMTRKDLISITRLKERREILDDRLRALNVKEDIFSAAAKAQSAKAPRRTKNNPEPLISIRQGTDFAFDRLENVYRSRRKVENEIRAVDDQMSALKKTRSIARVWVSGKGGLVRLSYYIMDQFWTPIYDFRLEGNGRIEVILRTRIPSAVKKSKISVVVGSITDTSIVAPHSIIRDELYATIEKMVFPIEEEHFLEHPASTLTFSFVNNTMLNLPAGQASGYWRGEYLGVVSFPGCRPGESSEVVFGK